MKCALGVLMLLLTLPLESPQAKPRDHVADFDGGTPSILSPAGGDSVKASEAICLEFWIGASPNAANLPMTAVELVAADARFTVTIAADRKSILLSNGAPNAADVPVIADLSGGQMIHLGFNFPPSGAKVYVDGLPLSGVVGPAFNPSDRDEPVQLRLGGPGFKGSIGGARLWSFGMSDLTMLASRNDPDDLLPTGGLPADDFVVGQVDAGQINRPSVPATGLWHEDGAATTIPVLKSLPGIPDVNHGQFVDDELFLSIFPSDKKFADFGFTTSVAFEAPWYLKRRVPGPLGLYAVLDKVGAEIGEVAFRPSGKAFVASKVGQTAPALPLRVGGVYKTLEVPLEGEQIQDYGEAWQVNDKPKNFEHSVMGCYSGAQMNMFDLQEHGCARRFFREPPAGSHRFDTGRNNLTIPWGWKYINFSESRSHGFSDMATSSGEVGGASSGGSGYNFSVAGVSYQNNKTVESEKQDIRETQHMRAYHQFVARRHSLVVDAKKMMLDQCFVRDVARLAFAVTGAIPQMPSYFDVMDTAGGECDALLDDPLPLEAFVTRYSDLYAYAVTYGARAVQRVDIDTASVAAMSKHGTNVSSGLDYAMSGSFTVPGTGLSTNYKLGAGVTSQGGQSQWDAVKNEATLNFDDLICVGGASCANAQVEVGDNPVPIYLDLRPMTDLLGPPYFADPAITGAVRRMVHDRLAKNIQPPTPDIAMMRIFDVKVSDVSCWSVVLGNVGTPYVNMQQSQIGPFVTGRRYGALNPPTPVAVIAEAITTMAQAASALASACSSDLLDNSVIEFAAENGGGPATEGTPRLLALPGEARSIGLGDMVKNGKQIRIMATMFDAALGGGPATHPQLYPRLRGRSDSARGQDACAAPCRFAFLDPNTRHVYTAGTGPNVPIEDTGEDFVLYPAFEGIDLTSVKKGGDVISVVLGRGISNLKNATSPAFGYGVNLKVTLTEAPDLAKAIGY